MLARSVHFAVAAAATIVVGNNDVILVDVAVVLFLGGEGIVQIMHWWMVRGGMVGLVLLLWLEMGLVLVLVVGVAAEIVAVVLN